MRDPKGAEACSLSLIHIWNLYVGDRSGTIFKIDAERQIFVFATLEPSISAYHLAFSPAGELFVTGPTTSSYDRVFRISPAGEVSVFFRGLGRPQGLAFDRLGNLYVAGSLGDVYKRQSLHVLRDPAAAREIPQPAL